MTDQAQLRVWTIPNLISFLRLLGVPLFLYLFLGAHAEIAAVVVLAVGGSSDWVDGYLARRLHQVSRLGELLDPFADRLYILATLLALSARGVIPWLFTAALLARDRALTASTHAHLVASGLVTPAEPKYGGTPGIFMLRWSAAFSVARRLLKAAPAEAKAVKAAAQTAASSPLPEAVRGSREHPGPQPGRRDGAGTGCGHRARHWGGDLGDDRVRDLTPAAPATAQERRRGERDHQPSHAPEASSLCSASLTGR